MHGSVMLEKNIDALMGMKWSVTTTIGQNNISLVDPTIPLDFMDTTPISSPTSTTALRAAMNDPKNFLPLLNRINISPISEQRRHYDVILESMLSTLSPSTPSIIVKRVVRIWQRYENLMPEKVYSDTVRLWLPDNCKPDDCEKTPLTLFRSNDRVFKSPLHFDCLMHMLSFYLDLSKRRAYERLYMFQSKARPVSQEYEERKEILHGYIGAQDMAIVQTLLEVCDGDVDKTPELLDIRKIACQQIHRMFISDSSSLLPKLVHYNTYPLRLIPIMVKGVPSAHVVINFIGEIMASVNIRRRVFGVHLMAELVQQYKIPVAFAGVELISDVLDTLFSCTVSDDILVLLHHVVPALGQLISASPFHASSFRQMLERVRQVSLARRAFYNGSIAARSSLERRLTDLIDSTMELCRKRPAADFKESEKPKESPKVKRFKLNDDRNRRVVRKAKLSGKTR